MTQVSESDRNEAKLNRIDVEKLVSTHYAKVYRFALSLARNEAEAADLTQQTYLILTSKGGQLKDLSKAKSWLFATLHREFLKRRRHTNRFIDIESSYEIVGDVTAVDANACRQVDAGLVMKSLGRVREVFRTPLALYYIGDLSYREIAEILDIPIGTVMARLFHGKAELRVELSVDPNLENAVIPLHNHDHA